VAEITKAFHEVPRPAGWFSAANCCEQFELLSLPLTPYSVDYIADPKVIAGQLVHRLSIG